ncbi:hypothetical protein [Sulfurovum mangrovi]|uniref:hypothetical protein n=1 Tax=Sulfurovum mangrovi TaxID=2893889 RepID=UPI001E386122|nr:hypothetical protein [Sulfurovum mangrovi]UFH59808.1 hypothetical protein LN246_02940 [Sulfurovum mangrovi]UFH59859.1 hypothetical protein LN246_03200 [Sulfurovum mangrovi]UFH60605.1 hypothetical protein LN246_13585 [Sulfurovum mangrovi]
MKVLNVITAIRNSFLWSEQVYTRGSCYKFYEILLSIFPQAVAWYSEKADHIVTCIDGVMYDITGHVTVGEDYRPLEEYMPEIIIAISNAKFNGHLDYIECPNCGDAIHIKK